MGCDVVHRSPIATMAVPLVMVAQREREREREREKKKKKKKKDGKNAGES